MLKNILFMLFISYNVQAQMGSCPVNPNGINSLIDQSGNPLCDIEIEDQRNQVLNTSIVSGEDINSASLNLKYNALSKALSLINAKEYVALYYYDANGDFIRDTPLFIVDLTRLEPNSVTTTNAGDSTNSFNIDSGSMDSAICAEMGGTLYGGVWASCGFTPVNYDWNNIDLESGFAKDCFDRQGILGVQQTELRCQIHSDGNRVAWGTLPTNSFSPSSTYKLLIYPKGRSLEANEFTTP